MAQKPPPEKPSKREADQAEKKTDSGKEPQETPKVSPSEKKTAIQKEPGEPELGETGKKLPMKEGRKIGEILKYVILALLLLIGFIVIKKSCKSKPPPPSPQGIYISSDIADFFKAMRKAVHEMAEGKKLYRYGLTKLEGLPPPESLPESLPTVEAGPAAQTAGSFALALEHYELADKILRDVRFTDNAGNINECRDTLVDALKQYTDAANILNENSKARATGDEKKLRANSPSDAAANFTMGEQLMAEALLSGCKGEFFKYSKTLDLADRGLIIIDYKEFFAEKFPEHQTHLETLLEYQAPAETMPAETRPETQPHHP